MRQDVTRVTLFFFLPALDGTHYICCRGNTPRACRRCLILTFGFAGLADRVHLIAWVTLALEVPFQVDTDLAAGVRILTLIDI